MTTKEYLRAFKRQYKKMHTIDKGLSGRSQEKRVWVTLMQNIDAIIKLLSEQTISKSMISKVALIMDKNLEEILERMLPNDALLVRVRDLVVSLILYCKGKKRKKK